MEKLPIGPLGYTPCEYAMTEGPYTGLELQVIVDRDPGYIQQLVNAGIYVASNGMTIVMNTTFNLLVGDMLVVDDPEQYQNETD